MKSNSLKTTNQYKLVYKILKMHKLNEINDKTKRLSQIMNTIEENLNLNNNKRNNTKKFSSYLLNQNLTKINFRRSMLITKKLKYIDKLNEEFDHEYNKQKIDYHWTKYQGYDSFSEDDDEDNIFMENKNDVILDFDSTQKRILKILYMKNKENEYRPFSNYRKNKKLNDLKSNIEYVCGIKLGQDIAENKKEEEKDELNKNTHYFIPLRKPRFIREKNIEDSFTPSMKYDKSKVYYEKKYKISKPKNDSYKKFTNYTLQNYLYIKNKNKNKIAKIKNEISPIKKNKIKKQDGITDKNDINQIPDLINKNDNSNLYFKTINTTKPFFKIKLKNNSHANHRNNSKSKMNNLKTENNNVDRKKISFILKKLLKDSYSLKNELKIGINIISSQLNDYKKQPKNKNTEINVDIGKLRKELNLIKINPVVRESDVVVKNEKKMEKKIRKEDTAILREIVNTVLQEDRLVSRNAVFNNNSLNSKLKKIMERKIKSRNVLENEDKDEEENEKIQIIKLFKKDNPDFFNIKHLSNLIKRYKTLKIK